MSVKLSTLPLTNSVRENTVPPVPTQRRAGAVNFNTNHECEVAATFGQRAADRLAAVGGSWMFIFLFTGVLVLWAGLNSFILLRPGTAFDPYPYILLNFFLSLLAVLQAPVIMMAQNRQAAQNRLDAAHSYEVSRQAVQEIIALHEKFDEVREKSWQEFMQTQQTQIFMLEKLVREQLSKPK